MASLGGRAGDPLRVSPVWGYTILWCETVTLSICGKYLSFFILFLFGLKTLWFSGEDLFFWSSHTFGPISLSFCSENLFFFGLCLFLVQKKVPTLNPAPGATIRSNASVKMIFFKVLLNLTSYLQKIAIFLRWLNIVFFWFFFVNKLKFRIKYVV